MRKNESESSRKNYFDYHELDLIGELAGENPGIPIPVYPQSVPAGESASESGGFSVEISQGEGAGGQLEESSTAGVPCFVMPVVEAFRGLTIFTLLVAHHISFPIIPETLTSAWWNEGIHLVDFIFPFFLLAAGLALSSHGTPSYSDSRKWCIHMLWAVKSAVVMFILGCIVDSTLAGKITIGFGILQYIGLGVLISNFLFNLSGGARGIIAAAALVGYWILIRYYPIPGAESATFTMEINAIRHIDKAILDPYNLDGILQLIPAASMVLIGTILGQFFKAGPAPTFEGMRKAVGVGVILILTGYMWNLDIPFNKSVLTPSYIVFTAGWAVLLTSLLYCMINRHVSRRFLYFFSALGANALFAYVLPILFRVHVLQGITLNLYWVPVSLKDELVLFLVGKTGYIPGNVLYTVILIGFWWLILREFYDRKVYLKP